MRWLWIDRIVRLDPGARLVALKSVTLAEDHLRDHFPARADPPAPAVPIMPASLIIEGMAQTAGILVGHAQDFRENVVLAKISRVELVEDAGPGSTLRYTATLEQIGPQGASTTGLVELIDAGAREAEARQIGRVDLIFSHLDGSLAGADLPAENFVFGESFRMMLRFSGIDAAT